MHVEQAAAAQRHLHTVTAGPVCQQLTCLSCISFNIRFRDIHTLPFQADQKQQTECQCICTLGKLNQISRLFRQGGVQGDNWNPPCHDASVFQAGEVGKPSINRHSMPILGSTHGSRACHCSHDCLLVPGGKPWHHRSRGATPLQDPGAHSKDPGRCTDQGLRQLGLSMISMLRGSVAEGCGTTLFWRKHHSTAWQN